MSTLIHSTAVIYPNVELGENVCIGAYCVIGGPPEHRDYYDGTKETKGVRIEDGARLFEFVTVHAGTEFPTEIGARSAIFQKAHVGHDCVIANDCTIGGQVSLAGFTTLMPHAIISGQACTHQHSIMGPYSFLAPQAFLKGNIPPGELWIGCPARPATLNTIGLERAGLTIDQVYEEWGALWDTITSETKSAG